MVWDRNNSQQEMDRAMIGLDVVFLFFLSFFLSLCVCLFFVYCSGCSICTGLMGLRADRFNPLIGFPVSGFPSPGLNLGGGVRTRLVSLDLDRTT